MAFICHGRKGETRSAMRNNGSHPTVSTVT
jgi:hypothetical protein